MLLREMQPARPLTWDEAHSVAERQAALLLDVMGVDAPPVPQTVIADVPGIRIERRQGWPTSGMAVWSNTQWRIVLNGSDPMQRQRFSLAHEFKHVLDDPFVADGSPYFLDRQHKRHAERICNHFAACLLMPRPWVVQDWRGGTHDAPSLARRYHVSTEAMRRRLTELRLHMRDVGGSNS